MAKIERTYLVCDGCGLEDPAGAGLVTAHRFSVDGASWALDACPKCWRTTYRDHVKALTVRAQRVKVPAKRRRLTAVRTG